MTHRLLPILAALLLTCSLAIVPAGCGWASPPTPTNPPTATPMPSPTPTLTPPPPSPTPPPPSPSPVPPSPTETLPTVSPSPTRVPTPTPAPSRLLKVIAGSVPLHELPSPKAAVVGYVGWLDPVGFLSGPDRYGYVRIESPSGARGFVRQEQVAEPDAVLYAEIPEMTLFSAVPEDLSPAKLSRLVDVRKEAPGLCIDLIFASDRNFTGVAIYDRDLCLLQRGTLDKLLMAQALFSLDGFTIKIYDAYRPYSATVRLFQHPFGPRYLADPAKGSTHNKGAAVDMTLVDANGVELEMPSLVHVLNAQASRENPLMTETARRNLDYVQGIMTLCGFIPYAHEWWHYTDSASFTYPYMDLRFADVTMVPATELPTVTPPPVRDPLETGFISVSPTPDPFLSPSPSPTAGPSGEPTPNPSAGPTPDPTAGPTPEPTLAPSPPPAAPTPTP